MKGINIGIEIGIDSGSFWNANNGITWNQLMPILDSWLIQNPNIQINYGQ